MPRTDSQRPRGLSRRGAGTQLHPGRGASSAFRSRRSARPSAALEARLGLRLLTRTTRSVAPTEAGERLLRAAGPRLEEIEAELAALSELRDKPAGTIRITAQRARRRGGPLARACRSCCRTIPDIKVEIVIDYGLTDIVAERYDAGVRTGEQVAKDMIAVRIGPDMRMAVVGAPSYFAKRPKPKTPQDLTAHDCINLRLPTHGGLYAWEFEKGRARAAGCGSRGSWCSTTARPMLNAALAGFGLAYRARGQVQPHLADGRLVRVLADWCPPFSGLSPLLPEPPPTDAGLRPAGRCAALSRLT